MCGILKTAIIYFSGRSNTTFAPTLRYCKTLMRGAVLIFLIFSVAGCHSRGDTTLTRLNDLKGRWEGTLDQFSHDNEGTFRVLLDIEPEHDGEFTGTMQWPDFNACQTRIEGHLQGTLLQWTETDFIEGDDVVLHGLYVANLANDNEIRGEWMDPQQTIYPGGPNYGTPGATFLFTRPAER